VLGGVRDVALIHYPSWTDSIKPSLQFLCNFVVINASEESLCFQIFFTLPGSCVIYTLCLYRVYFSLIMWKAIITFEFVPGNKQAPRKWV
jgi:hypothetical protein